jgi:hypothetical protein
MGALTQITTPAAGATDWSDFVDQVEKHRRGYMQVSLTNMTNTSAPSVAEGSVVVVAGAFYHADEDEAVSGGSVSAGNLNYIRLESGEPSWTTTAPTWSDSKQGWYDATEAYRYIGGCYYDGSDYVGKFVYDQNGRKINYATDITLAGGTTTQRIIYCNDFNVTANSTLNCRTLYIEGDLHIDSGVTLTISQTARDPDSDRPLANMISYQALKYWPGAGGDSGTEGGEGCLGGTSGNSDNANGGGGGGSLTSSGGNGRDSSAGALSGGTPLISGVGYLIGGDGGNSDAVAKTGGGGGGPGGGGASGRYSGTQYDGGDGGGFITIIVKGTFNNEGSIVADGEAGENQQCGGGGGGMILVFALGDTVSLGTIQAQGGNASGDGGGGGGGHIHVAAHETVANINSACDVSGGTAADGDNGSDGTIYAIDLDTDPYGAYGGEDSDEYTGLIMTVVEGLIL